jgi:hypothetical protein
VWRTGTAGCFDSLAQQAVLLAMPSSASQVQALLRASPRPGTDEDVVQREPFVINLTDTRCVPGLPFGR